MNDAHDMDDAAWWQDRQKKEAWSIFNERAALLRVARNTASYGDAVLLAQSLNHGDLFTHAQENNATDIEDDPE